MAQQATQEPLRLIGAIASRLVSSGDRACSKHRESERTCSTACARRFCRNAALELFISFLNGGSRLSLRLLLLMLRCATRGVALRVRSELQSLDRKRGRQARVWRDYARQTSTLEVAASIALTALAPPLAGSRFQIDKHVVTHEEPAVHEGGRGEVS